MSEGVTGFRAVAEDDNRRANRSTAGAGRFRSSLAGPARRGLRPWTWGQNRLLPIGPASHRPVAPATAEGWRATDGRSTSRERIEEDSRAALHRMRREPRHPRGLDRHPKGQSHGLNEASLGFWPALHDAQNGPSRPPGAAPTLNGNQLLPPPAGAGGSADKRHGSVGRRKGPLLPKKLHHAGMTRNPQPLRRGPGGTVLGPSWRRGEKIGRGTAAFRSPGRGLATPTREPVRRPRRRFGFCRRTGGLREKNKAVSARHRSHAPPRASFDWGILGAPAIFFQ